MTRVGLAAALVVVLVAGCGSTVPPSSRQAIATRGSVPSLETGTDQGQATSSEGADTGAVSTPSSGGRTTGSVAAPVPGAKSAAPSSPAAHGVSEGSINVGILVEDFDKSAATFAVKDSGQGDQQAQAQAVINYINAHGGAGGRTLVPVFHHNDPASGTFAQQNQAACAAFTEDHKVLAVTPQNFEMDSLIACLAKKGVPLVATDHVFGAWSDQVQLDQYADYLYLPSTMNFTRSGAVIDGLFGAGFFGNKPKIGLLYLDSPSIVRAVDKAVKPALAAHGLQLTDAVAISAPASETDVSNDAAQASSAVLRFRSENIDHVLFLEGAGEIPFLFMPQADAQGYRPRYGLSSYDEPEWLTVNAPLSQLAGALGVGWIPSLDVADTQDPGNPAAALCLQIMKAAGQNVTQDRSHEHSAFGFCSSLFFLQAAFTGAPSLDPKGLRTRIESLGSTFASALTFSTSFRPGRHDGAATAATLAFDGGCSCFKYTSAPRSIP